MSLNEITSVDLSSSYTTVIRSLGFRVPAFRPGKRVVVHVEEVIFLFQTEPGDGLFGGLTEVRIGCQS